MSQKYSVNYRSGQPVDVSKHEFDRLRKMARLFTYSAKKKRLTLKPEYFSWLENDERRFQEKETKRVFTLRSPEDSCARVERICGPLNPQYIKDPFERQRQIERQYS